MSKWPHLPDDPRLRSLLADRATEGLSEPDARELERCLDDYPGFPDECLDLAAAEFDLAFSRGATEELPSGLRERLQSDALEWMRQRPVATAELSPVLSATGGRPSPRASAGRHSAPRAPSSDASRPAQGRAVVAAAESRAPRGGWLGALGWLGAAACLAVILRLQWPAPTPGEARAALLATTPDAVVLPWSPLDDSRFAAVKGDVVWSASKREGYLRLIDFPASEATDQQYQLWIVDGDRDSKPVDGGIFDIARHERDTVVPIRAALDCPSPDAFALTLEKRGGVVVSDGPLLTLAK